MTFKKKYLRMGFPYRIAIFLLASAGFSIPCSGQTNSGIRQVLQTYCISCHNAEELQGGLNIEHLLNSGYSENGTNWVTVLSALEEQWMPPTWSMAPRPSDEEYKGAAAELAHALTSTTGPEKVSDLDELQLINNYCTSCHSGNEAQSGLDIAALLNRPIHENAGQWEHIVRKMSARQMPPLGRPRPDPETYEKILTYLSNHLDEAYAANPNPGRTSTFRRLTRAEYQNAIRDLLAVEIDASTMLPRDEVSHGFDNITVTGLSPTLLDRYLSASRKIARMAVGGTLGYPDAETIRVKPDLTQDKHIPGLPLGTRGGTLIPHHFHRSGTYRIDIKLSRDRNEIIEGLWRKHEMDVLLNRELAGSITLERPKDNDQANFDKNLFLELNVEAGQHELAVTFRSVGESISSNKRKPLESAFNLHRHPRQAPAIYMVSITGPLEDRGAGDTVSRQKIFGTSNKESLTESEYARQIIERLARLAYRRPIADADLKPLMDFYQEGYDQAGFETGVEAALRAILVNPNFLFRIEKEPHQSKPGETYAINDIDLASRLSFFLWSSIPDEELISLAEQGQLSNPDILRQQTRRMLNDPKSRSLTEQFAGQWLYLRNIESVIPDARLYPDFDENLRQAMRRETELLFEHVVQEDLSVMELLTADYTHLNERLAKHYDIPHIYGNHFRRVELKPEWNRGGILRHGGILAVTSYANRTSPTIRGNWILENIVGAPPPPPPPDVPALEDNVVSESLPIRERLAAHRDNPGCAGCHELMDPIGFALENFDPVGRWRMFDNELPVDATGELADGSSFNGAAEFEAVLLKYPENYVRTVVEKLMTFGLGRGLEHYDMNSVREIVAAAEQEDYTFSSLIIGIVNSTPFKQRTVL